MLTATAVEPERGAPAPPSVQVVVRRRQVLASLLAGAVGCGVLAAAGFTALWWAAIVLVLLAAGYLTLVARLRHLRVQRRLDQAFGSDIRNDDDLDWGALERELHLSLARDDDASGVAGAGLGGRAVSVQVGNRAIARFLVGWAIGWLLTPVVSVIRLVRGDLSILERHGLAHRIVRLQQYGRSQSLRLLTVGAAAGVTLTAVGGLTASTAGASPMVAAVSTTAAAAGTPASSTYTVVRGDTLSGIAERTGTSVNALAGANHLANPNFLLPGEVLSVSGSSTAAAGSGTHYVVRAGDTLDGIARTHGTTVAALASANGIANPNRIFPGQALTVPAGSGASTAAPAAVPTPAATAATAVPGRYVVRAGDTVSAVARRYGTTVAALSAANHLANPNAIFPGQVLTLPTAPAAAAPAPAKVGGPTPVAAAPAPTPPPPAPTAANVAQSALPLPAQYLQGGTVDQGVDYAAPGGTPLYAMGPGTIIRAGMDGFGPNCPVLEITAGPLAGKTVYYGHAGPNLVPVGATVAAGQQISIVGYGIVGYSTGPHLEVGFYPPGGDGAGGTMLNYINHAVGHNTGA